MSPHDIVFPILGLVMGLLLGMLGSGGSILALPAFVYTAGLPIKSSVATSLAVVGATSLIGAILAKWRCSTHGCPGQEVDTKVTALMTVGGLVGAFGGSRLSVYIPAEIQMFLFGMVMLGAAAGMLRRQSQTECDLPTETSNALPVASSPHLLILPLGLCIGLLTGIVGVGGGFLIVPALTLLAKVPVKRAAAMSLWIIAANSAVGLLGYLGRVPVAWGTASLFLAVALVGLIIGQRFAAHARPHRLQKAFALFLVIVGVFTIVKTELGSQRPSSKVTASSKRGSLNTSHMGSGLVWELG